MISDFAERFMFAVAMGWAAFVIGCITLNLLFGG